MLDIKLYSKELFKQVIEVTDDTVEQSSDYFICVNSTGHIHGIPYFNQPHINVLNCTFDDTDHDHTKFDNIFNVEFSAKACTPEQAETIVKFIDTIPDGSVVHIYCAKGKSRSPAIAKFISERRNNTDMETPSYNTHVYELLKNVRL